MAVWELLAEMLAEHPEANRTLAERVSGLAIAYPAEEGAHPLAGHRAPDFELDLSSGPARLFELRREPVLRVARTVRPWRVAWLTATTASRGAIDLRQRKPKKTPPGRRYRRPGGALGSCSGAARPGLISRARPGWSS